MSTLAQSAVQVLDFWYEQGANSKLFKAVSVVLTLTGQGNYANPIPPSLFGLSSITQVRNAADSSTNVYACAASPDGTTALIGEQGTTTGATKNIVAAGLASAGNITASGVVATDVIKSVTDLTTPAALNPANFTPGSGVIAQASGAGNISSKTLQFILKSVDTPSTCKSSFGNPGNRVI